MVKFDTEAIKNIEWRYLVNRKEALLLMSMPGNYLCYRELEKAAGIKWEPKAMIRSSDGDFFLGVKDYAKLAGIFAVGGRILLSKFRAKLIKHVSDFNRLARRINSVDATKLDNKQIVNLTKEYFSTAWRACCFLAPVPVADSILSKLIIDQLPPADDKTKQEWIGTLIFPVKDNSHFFEERSFFRLAAAAVYKNRLPRLIRSHLRQWGWIGTRWFWLDREWTPADVKERLRNFFVSGQNPLAELQNLLAAKKERKIAAEKLWRQLKIVNRSKLSQLIRLAREYAFLRTWRTDVIYRAGYLARNLFFEVARRAGVAPADLLYLTFYEVIAMAKTKRLPITAGELAKRKSALVTVSLGEKYRIYSGRENYKKFRNILKREVAGGREVLGVVAYPGKVRATAKLVFDGDDIKKVKRGDVMIAVMTFPNFVPAMEKAAAFVTDEGGILCHAAIIAREMKKPCIIGTKIATKVFKDGDRVEVDATKGIVRKL